MTTLFQDLRYAARTLIKSPGFAAAAAATLALGIGATTAVFSLVHGLLLRPLPFSNQDSLLLISESTRWNSSSSVAYPNFLDWRARQRSFSSMGVMRPQEFNLTGGDMAERASGAMVSHDLFHTLGVRPTQGRLFAPEEDAPGAARTVLIRESLWRRRLAGSTAAVGQQLAMHGDKYTIIGILPDSTVVPYNSTEFWVPVGLWANEYGNRRQHPGLRVIGRLKPGVSVASARADLAAIAEQLARQYPDSNGGNGVQLVRLTDYLFKKIRPAMLVLAIAVACVMLIACANVAGLLMVRALTGRREAAIRLALGAGRARLVRMLLAESLLLGLAGTLGGVLASPALVAAITSILPAATPRLAQVGVSAQVLAFSAVLGLITSVAFGLLPGLQMSSVDVAAHLTRAGLDSPRARQRPRALLVAGEFCLTVVLLIASTLMMRTLYRLYRTDLGFRTERVLTFTFDLPDYAFASGKDRLQTEQQIMPRLAALPGVAGVGYTTALPLTTRANFNGFTIEGGPDIRASELPMADTANVSPGYFAAMGISLLRGRAFSEVDTGGAERVAIIDAVLAARHFPGGDPIGQRLKIGDAASDLPWMRIVGIAQHVAKSGLESESGPQLYRPVQQGPAGFAFTFALRTLVEPTALEASVRHVFRDVSPAVPVFGFQTMSERFDESVWSSRLTTLLLGVFAGLATLLSMVGLYGLMAYSVTQRTHEIGVRLALGESPSDIVRRITHQGLLLAGTGSALGIAAAFWMSQLMRGLLYGTSPNDPATFATVAGLSLIVALLACWIPARRAARVDPMVALRCE